MKNPDRLHLDCRVSAKPGLVAAPMNEELVMLDMEQGMYFALDDIGTVIWSSIVEPVSIADLCRQLVSLYSIDELTCQTDTLTFLEELRALGILEVHG